MENLKYIALIVLAAALFAGGYFTRKAQEPKVVLPPDEQHIVGKAELVPEAKSEPSVEIRYRDRVRVERDTVEVEVEDEELAQAFEELLCAYDDLLRASPVRDVVARFDTSNADFDARVEYRYASRRFDFWLRQRQTADSVIAAYRAEQAQQSWYEQAWNGYKVAGAIGLTAALIFTITKLVGGIDL